METKSRAERMRAEKRREGRPSALTRKRLDLIKESLSVTGDVSLAAAYAGIHRDTIYEWVNKAAIIHEEIDKAANAGLNLALTQEALLYLEFSDTIKRADAMYELRSLAAIQKIGMGKMEGHWQALAWGLERTFPNKYARRLAIPVVPELDEAERPEVEESHRELNPYEPERIARFVIGLKEAGIIGQEVIDGIIERGSADVPAHEIPTDDDQS